MFEGQKYLPGEMVYVHNYLTGFYDPGYITEDVHRDENGVLIYILDDGRGGNFQMIAREKDMLSAQEYAERMGNDEA